MRYFIFYLLWVVIVTQNSNHYVLPPIYNRSSEIKIELKKMTLFSLNVAKRGQKKVHLLDGPAFQLRFRQFWYFLWYTETRSDSTLAKIGWFLFIFSIGFLFLLIFINRCSLDFLQVKTYLFFKKLKFVHWTIFITAQL